MYSFRRLALLLALSSAAMPAVLAQSSSSNPATPDAAQPPAAAAQAQEAPTSGQLSVQARIKARREQRRAAAIHDAYAHRYEAYFGMGYLRFEPGKTLERDHEYAWDLGATRYLDDRLGITVDGRGYFGSAYVYNNAVTNSAITNAEVSQFAALAGPTYRFYALPKFSVSGRVMAGMAYGHFSGDTSNNQQLSTALGLWPDSYVFAASAALIGEYNLTPRVGLRLAPEYFPTGFGSSIQSSLGFTGSVAYRFGKR
jgi:hypothetical protein